MSEKKQSRHPYVRPTTLQQRQFLFELYERTPDVEEACRLAHVGRSTFYFWKARFDEGGYLALGQRSHARHTYSKQVPLAIVEEVAETRKAHPDWGRHQIAGTMAQNHGWQAVVSPSEVRRILIAAGLVIPQTRSGKKGGLPPGMPTPPAKPST
jgi:transposase